MAGNLTRINNNQITDASGANAQLGINANTKVQDYSVTSAKLANNFTYGNNFTITGNLQVNGNTTTIDTTTLTVEDPLILLASGQTATPTVDIGYIGERGTANNIASVWDESQGTFITVFTDSLATDTTVNILGYADFKTNNANVIGNLTVGGNLSLTGNVASLTVTGNVVAGNVFSNGSLSATGTANVGNLVTQGNITGNNINTSNVLITSTTVSAEGNIAAGNINTAGAVSATGNVSGNNIFATGFISAVGNITANVGSFFIGNGSQLTGLPAGSFIANGTSNINIATANSDITMAVSGQGSVVVVNPTGLGAINLSTIGNVSVQGNVIANNISIPNVLISDSSISALGNITTANFFIGDGSQLTNVVANVSTVANGTSNVSIATANGNITMAVSGTADVVVVGPTGLSVIGVVNANSNITGGNLLTAGFVSADGNVTGGNILTANIVSAGGNVTGGNIFSSGTGNIVGTITGGNVETAGNITATGNISTANSVLVGNVVSSTGNIISNANVNGNNINSTHLITGANVSITGNVIVDTNVNAGIVITTNIATPAGNALTIFGNTGITFSSAGNINAGNLYINTLRDPVQDQDAATKIYVDNKVSTGISYHEAVFAATTTTLAATTGGTIAYNQPNGAGNGIGATLSTSTTFTTIDTANINSVGTRILVKNEANAAHNGIYVYANSTSIVRSNDTDTYGAGNVDALGLNDYFFVQSGNVNIAAAYVVDAPTGTITFGTSNITFAQFSQSKSYSANTSAGLTLIGETFNAKVDGVTTAFDGTGNIVVKSSANLTTPNIGNATFQSLSAVGGTGNIIANNISSVGSITGVDFVASGNVSATGYVLGSNVFVTSLGNTTIPYANSTGGLLSDANFNYTANVLRVGNVSTTGTVVANGNITAANFTTTGSSGNITGANFITANTFSASGSISGNAVSVNGNVTANYYFGDGSQLSNLSAGSQIVNGTSNVAVIANANVTIGIAGTSNIVVVSNIGLATSGNLSATGNVYAPAIVNNGTYNTQVALGASTGIVEINSNGNGTQFGPGGVITLAGASQIQGGTFGGSGFTAGTSQTDLFQNRGGNVTVQVGTGGTTTSTWTFANSGNLLAPGNISAVGNITSNSFFIGNGSQLTGLPAGTFIANGTSNVNIAAANGNITMGVNGTANVVVVDSTGMTVTANISATGNVSVTGNVSAAGSLSATGNITGNVITGNTANIVNNALAGSLSVTGNVNGGGVFFVDTSTNTASFGNSTQTTNAIVAFNATNSILMPVGNTAQRPATGVTGMVRWSTTESALEAYDGTEWSTVGAQQFTVIDNAQFNGTGNTVAFTLPSVQTTDSCIVTINGVVQIPTTAYAVSGNVLTFTEAPAIADTIDVRTLTTTTTVIGLSAPNISLTGNIVAALGNTPTTALANSSLTFSLANNTSLIVSVKGTDGTVRSATITLAP